jgi:hypothetical protein
MNTVRKIAGSAAKLPLRREGAGSNFAGAFAASRWRRDMKKLLAVLAVAAVVAPPALAASNQNASQSQHPYARSHEGATTNFA